MNRSRRRSSRLAGLFLLAAILASCGDRAPAAPGDLLARRIAQGLDQVRTHADSSDFWNQVKGSSLPMLERAEAAHAEGWDLVALNRLGAGRVNLDGYLFARRFPASARSDTAGFAEAWRREGDSLRSFPPASAERARRIRPAAIRALAEAAIPQVRNFYEASLEYGYSTEPTFGFFYMGTARSQREFFDLCAALSAPSAGREPAFRSIVPEMDALEAEILAAYRPPLSLDRHPEFIGVSSTLKEARELDAEGLQRGALFRYLFSVLRFAPLRPAAGPVDSAAAIAKLDSLDARLRADAADHSIARLFLETARAEQKTAGDHPAPVAVAVVNDVIPSYFAALEPAAPRAVAAGADVRVTLVRWPYT